MRGRPRTPERKYKYMFKMLERDHRRLRIFATGRDIEYGDAIVLLLDIYDQEQLRYRDRMPRPTSEDE